MNDASAVEWDYRVVEIARGGETWRGICVVYYTDGAPTSRTEDFIPLAWEIDDAVGGMEMLEGMREALERPVLTHDDFQHMPGSGVRQK